MKHISINSEEDLMRVFGNLELNSDVERYPIGHSATLLENQGVLVTPWVDSKSSLLTTSGVTIRLLKRTSESEWLVVETYSVEK